MTQKVLITAALLYGNGRLHFGHLAGSYLPAECYARFMRFCGADVLFLSGLDEYGAPITLSAEKEGHTPKEHVDYYYQKALSDFEKLNFSFDLFSRTTWPGHSETTLEFFQDLKNEQHVSKITTKQLYSPKDDKFLADRYVEGTCPKCAYEKARGDECPKCGQSFEPLELISPKSKLTKAPLVLKDTEHYFLQLPHFKEELKKWVGQKKWRAQVSNMALQYIDDLKPRSITRDLNWGIPVPGETKKVFYVWFDAPIGYISAAKDWAKRHGKPNAWESYWLDPKTKYVQFVGKDNIPFHAVFFPAMTMGQNKPYKLVDDLPANAFFHYEGKKFSKSEGWFIDLDDFFKKFTSDQIRYTLAANAPENDDAEFAWRDFQNKNNADLVGKLGNFINRTFVFTHNKADGIVPTLGEAKQTDTDFLLELHKLADELKQSHQNYHLRKASQILMKLATRCNQYFDDSKPWVCAKTDLKRTQTILHHCLLGIKALSVCAYAIMPNFSQTVWQMLGFKEKLTNQTFDERLAQKLPEHQKLLEPKILFPKIEDDLINMELDKLKESDKTSQSEELIEFETFSKLDLKVAEILTAEPVEKSHKLLKLTVDVGEDQPRPVVSGVQKYYESQDLIGKKVILVANLKPVKIMGEESQGMILAATCGKLLEVPFITSLPAGAQVS